MELYVNPQITGFRQDVDGTIKELKIGSNKEDAYENIIEQGGAKLDNNKSATIDVSTYTEPVVINPTSGKDGMKKATVTLSNIPSPSGGVTAYCWYSETADFDRFTNFDIAPETITNEEVINGATKYGNMNTTAFSGENYTKISDTSFDDDGDVYVRDPTKDYTIIKSE